MKIRPELTGQMSLWSNVEAIEERQTEETMNIYLLEEKSWRIYRDLSFLAALSHMYKYPNVKRQTIIKVLQQVIRKTMVSSSVLLLCQS